MSKSISTKAAIENLKSGVSLENNVLSDLATTQVDAMDALLLAENGIVVPDGNIIYDDLKVAYDEDFDEGEWGEPLSVKDNSILKSV